MAACGLGPTGAGAIIRKRYAGFIGGRGMNEESVVKVINLIAIALMACMGLII